MSTGNEVVSYSERLKDPRWQRRRLERLNRAEFTCQHCDATDRTLHVHHKRYRKGAMPWEYEDHELEVLCDKCHATGHDLREKLAKVICELPFSDLEQLLGYAHTLLLSLLEPLNEGEDDPLFKKDWPVPSPPYAEGMADGLKLDWYPVPSQLYREQIPIGELIQMRDEAYRARRSRNGA